MDGVLLHSRQIWSVENTCNRVLTKESSDQLQLLSGKKVAFIHNLSSKKGAKLGGKT